MSIFNNVVTGIIGCVWVPPAIFIALQLQEELIVGRYLKKIGLHSNSFSDICSFRDRVMSDFTPTPVVNQPFLRRSASWLIKHKIACCGEATRILVVLLSRLGYDATRLTLYDKHCKRPRHTLVSLEIEGKEVLLDSFNNGIEEVVKLLKEPMSPREDNALMRRYTGYSYEAIPLSKFLPGMRVLNFRRPPRWVSVLAEKPHIVRIILFTVMAVIVTHMVWI